MKKVSTITSTFLKLNFAFFLAAGAVPSAAQNFAEIERELQDFYSSDARALKLMNLPVKKMDVQGNIVQGKSKFSAKDIRNKTFVANKNSLRDRIFKISSQGIEVSVKDLANQGRAAFSNNDLVESLVDNSSHVETNLAKMDEEGLTSARLKETPWSDTYWPLYRGATGQRYNDTAFPGSKDWKLNFDYISKTPVLSNVDSLSPAEKYDLLVGDSSKTYTLTQWDEGKLYNNNKDGVATWMGLCHGWAPAAFMLPRPEKAVVAIAADGVTKINFYPSDIKALATSLWASARIPSRFIGGRCNIKDPAQCSAGRVKDQDCFDSNPGTFHMTAVNQIGIAKRSFVIDATYDEEVWNQPAYSYQYTYVNPQHLKATNKLEEAIVPMSEFSRDRFSKFRNNPEAVSVVGISMAFTYVVETDPSSEATDSPEKDAVQTALYKYDLELDAKGNIVGGEWYTNKHPDFIWVPAADARASSVADAFAIGKWDPTLGKSIPLSYQVAAMVASRSKLPLAKIVDSLIEASRK